MDPAEESAEDEGSGYADQRKYAANGKILTERYMYAEQGEDEQLRTQSHDVTNRHVND